MKIEWNQNPLDTKIFLDENDRHHLKVAIQLDAAQSAISYRDLRDKQTTEEDKARYNGYIPYYDNLAYDEDEIKLDKEVANYEEELQSGHIGDCTCFPASCSKCRAESLLGIDTIKGLGKHEASNIDSHFWDSSTKPYTRKSLTINELLAKLEIPYSWETRNPVWDKYPREQYESHIPRWEEERKNAITWVKKYKEEHGF